MKEPTQPKREAASNQKANKSDVNQSFFHKSPKEEAFFKPEGEEQASEPPEPFFNSGQTKKNPQLPVGLQSNLQKAFGQDFSNVTIRRNSSEAAKLDARAFVQQEQIHFAPGEFNPDTKQGRSLIGHEFTHIAQQRAGRVKPTQVLGKDVNVNDDPVLEQEADRLGAQAIKGTPVPKYQSAGLGIRNSLRTVQAKSNVIQMAKKTVGGIWDTNRYDLRKDVDHTGAARKGARGVDIVIKFTPEAPTDAQLIGLVQSVQTTFNSKPLYKYNPTIQNRSVGPGSPIEGAHIDNFTSSNNPLYHGQSLEKEQTLGDTQESINTTPDPNVVDDTHDSSTGANTHHQLGFPFKTSKRWKTQDAMLYDGPTILTGAEKNSKQVFEITALAVKGKQTGTYYGSVQWGWETDAADKHKKIPFKVINHGVPSDNFMETAKVWNASWDATGADSVDLPIYDVIPIYQGPNDEILGVPPSLRLPRETPVRVLSNNGPTAHIEVSGGAYNGQRGFVTSLGGLPFTNIVT